jgi:phage tail tape-measure protein
LLSELKLLAFPYRKPHTAGSTSDTLKIVQPEDRHPLVSGRFSDPLGAGDHNGAAAGSSKIVEHARERRRKDDKCDEPKTTRTQKRDDTRARAEGGQAQSSMGQIS